MVRVHVWVKGRVQGVGFRAHAQYHAGQIGGITGWVRNVGWDTVESIVEGSREDIQRFIEALKQGPRMSRIDEITVEYETATGEFSSFSVKGSR
ncbi:MAG: acylphosphatase [Chloroflexi bacterium]|nr:acylphosphatase [Chloroflexota bacterium]